MNLEFNPYNILGVADTASTEEIKAAYRRIARRLHPDVNPNSKAAAAQFQDVTIAYELLVDPLRRKSYDERIAREGVNESDLYFTLQVTPSKRTLMTLPEQQVIYLLTEIFPDPRAHDLYHRREARLNLTLVLDRSNSMSGTRMEKVKVAAYQIIENLNDDDILSVVSFNDRAEVVVPATTIDDRPALKAKVGVMNPSGGTEIFQGLYAGVQENRKFLGPRLVNHIILLTDGHTFGDQERCIELAVQAASEGIGISAMGLGHDWNDEFLDELASKTGGNTSYVNSASAVVRFLNDYVRNLVNAFAERIHLSVATDPDVVLESAFKLSPHPQPVEADGGDIPLGSLQANRPIAVLLQFQLPPNLKDGFRYVARLVAQGEILSNKQQKYQMITEFASEVTDRVIDDDPPSAILDALSKLTLYRLQEKAKDALEQGDVGEATRRLENLATRLLAMGERELADQALSEARRVAHTSHLSDKGRKTLKYQTRHLLLGPANEE
ncbi:MAG: VWA domain-containing protein [Anaerolineae bacterium]